MSKRWLPKYVSAFLDRHGRQRFRYRRKGYEGGYFTAAPGTEEFRKELNKFGKAKVDTVVQAVKDTLPGSIDELVTRYISVPSRLGPSVATQTKIKGILCKFRDEHGHRITADVEFEHIEAIIERRKVKAKNPDTGRMEGGIEAARKLRKELVRLFDFAIAIKQRTTNPVRQSARVRVPAGEKSLGFYSWTEDDIETYRKRHPLGTKARLALELLLWTDQRRIDTIHLGRANIERGRFKVRQTKTGKVLHIKIPTQLAEAIATVPLDMIGEDCLLVSEKGTPFTNGSFGNWFRKRCNEAGLMRCTAHGLRKATLRRGAELNIGNQGLKALSGHTKDDEVARYTASANQIRLADYVVDLLSQWEKGEVAAALLLTDESQAQVSNPQKLDNPQEAKS